MQKSAPAAMETGDGNANSTNTHDASSVEASILAQNAAPVGHSFDLEFRGKSKLSRMLFHLVNEIFLGKTR
jgi:hypothetical protein